MLKTSANKNVFKCLLKVAGVDWRWMCSGRRFQAAGPAYAKARSPNFESVCCTKSNSPCTHQRPVYQLCIIRCSTIIAFGVWTFRGSLTFIWRNFAPWNFRFLQLTLLGSWNFYILRTFVPERKVLEIFAPFCRKRMFHRTFVPGSESSMERKFQERTLSMLFSLSEKSIIHSYNSYVVYRLCMQITLFILLSVEVMSDVITYTSYAKRATNDSL